jgi:ribonuclease BN (tRNA processing enzyme)
MDERTDIITFLGTAGARIMVTRQILASGGTWLKLADANILLDPGPGSLVQAVKRKLDPAKLDAIILSHKHIDHSVDINIMIEAMTGGGWNRRGKVFVPKDALGEGAVVLPYLQEFPESIEMLGEGKSYAVGNINFQTPVKHNHPVETYGFTFTTPKYVFSWIVDTKYFDELADFYTGDLLIINMVLLEPRPPVAHLSYMETKWIIEQVKPKVAIITHFGMGVWRAKPWDVARQLSEDTGVSVLAAYDGMNFDLTKMKVIQTK